MRLFSSISRQNLLIKRLNPVRILLRRDYSAASVAHLAPHIQEYILEKAALCQPDDIYVCDGSDAEKEKIIQTLLKEKLIKPIPKLENCFLAKTDPKDVARVESKTVISTENERETIPIPAEGVEGKLGKWMAPGDLQAAIQERFPGCMKGRTMYVIPFSMGPIGGSISKYGIELTDSPYVVASMGIMTRVNESVLEEIGSGEFVKCLHSVGCPLPLKRELTNNWPCNPEQVLVTHIPKDREIISFGSGYGGNSLLGKKCFALRIGSTIARDEGWLAEHMLILGITNPQGEKKYIAAAFPSACGKTNLAMMAPTIPGWKVECVGDDIAWMKFDKDGKLRAINPENGFFGVAPGTSEHTNPNAMTCMEKNTVYTNVAETSDGNIWWEGIGHEPTGDVTDWKNQPWTKESGTPAAHPNSRFCAPAGQCPTIDPQWESAEGVPIEAIVFGGRRPEGVPLVYEANSWEHGVFLGAAMRSEATAAAEFKGKAIMNDPFAMRPFFGYNFGHYLQHWLDVNQEGRHMPKIFNVNWFRKNENGFIWPGFGENSRVLEWIIRRCDGEDIAQDSIIGKIPKSGSLNMEGCDGVDLDACFELSSDFWKQEAAEVRTYLEQQVGEDCPAEIYAQCDELAKRASQ